MILPTPKNVTRTFRNIGRIRQIASVFAKYGFGEVMRNLGFASIIPKGYRGSKDTNLANPAERLRKAFEDLGPTFIKLGQVLSSRADLIPEAFVEELTKLQDHVEAVPFEQIREVLEKELAGPVEDYFSYFSNTPLASASIGQVYEAKLKDGTEVVVKVQRPGIEQSIKSDISILRMLASGLERYSPEMEVLAPTIFVEEFFQTMSLELDFVIEANNILKAKKNLAELGSVYIPEVYLNLCTQRILVIQRLKGIQVNQNTKLREAGFNPKELASFAAQAFVHAALEDGFFHGDLHGGNLFALKAKDVLPAGKFQGDQNESTPLLGIIDFGVMGYLTPRSRESLLRIFVSLADEDFETLCMEFAEMGASRGRTDFLQFQRNLQSAVAPYLGLPLSSVNIGKLLLDATNVAAKHHIRVPREWILVFKAIFTLEGTCRKLDPEFNVMHFLETYVTPMLQPKLSVEELSRDLLLGSRDVQQIFRALPRQLHWFFKRLAANNYALEIRDAEAERNREANAKNFSILANAIFAASLVGLATFAWAKGATLICIGLVAVAFFLIWRRS